MKKGWNVNLKKQKIPITFHIIRVSEEKKSIISSNKSIENIIISYNFKTLNFKNIASIIKIS